VILFEIVWRYGFIRNYIVASHIDTLIADCASWAEFRELVGRQTKSKDKGDLFERLTQIYLQTHPTYRSKIKNVWWCNNGELPEQVRKKLNLPETDEGIDLLCETYEGEYWSVRLTTPGDGGPVLAIARINATYGLDDKLGANLDCLFEEQPTYRNG
jgi:hypothetical protein